MVSFLLFLFTSNNKRATLYRVTIPRRVHGRSRTRVPVRGIVLVWAAVVVAWEGGDAKDLEKVSLTEEVMNSFHLNGQFPIQI